MKDKLLAHQETISILSKQKEAQINLYKTWKDKELDKVIELGNKVKVLDNIVYKTGQTVQMMNMLNNKCRMSFAKPEFLKKAQRSNPRLYDIDSLRSQLETQKTQFLKEIDRLSREYYYADHMNAILGVYTELDEDLKAQLQDKGIVISELKKLIEKLKGKFVDNKFEKSSVIRQPNAFKSQRPSVLGKPTTFSNSFANTKSKGKALRLHVCLRLYEDEKRAKERLAVAEVPTQVLEQPEHPRQLQGHQPQQPAVSLVLGPPGNGYDKKRTKSKQNRTKPSTKRKAWKSQQKVKPDKIKAKETKKSKGAKEEGLKLSFYKVI
nr:hypothetical protein [Tanacetum cinerariifolium]